MELNKSFPVRVNEYILELAIKKCKDADTTLSREVRKLIMSWADCSVNIERKEVY